MSWPVSVSLDDTALHGAGGGEGGWEHWFIRHPLQDPGLKPARGRQAAQQERRHPSDQQECGLDLTPGCWAGTPSLGSSCAKAPAALLVSGSPPEGKPSTEAACWALGT